MQLLTVLKVKILFLPKFICTIIDTIFFRQRRRKSWCVYKINLDNIKCLIIKSVSLSILCILLLKFLNSFITNMLQGPTCSEHQNPIRMAGIEKV